MYEKFALWGYKGICRSGSLCPLFFNLGTRWGWVLNCTPGQI